jgi:hypothetical protein
MAMNKRMREFVPYAGGERPDLARIAREATLAGFGVRKRSVTMKTAAMKTAMAWATWGWRLTWQMRQREPGGCGCQSECVAAKRKKPSKTHAVARETDKLPQCFSRPAMSFLSG